VYDCPIPKYDTTNVTDVTIAPTQAEHADALGVRTRADKQSLKWGNGSNSRRSCWCSWLLPKYQSLKWGNGSLKRLGISWGYSHVPMWPLDAIPTTDDAPREWWCPREWRCTVGIMHPRMSQWCRIIWHYITLSVT